MKTTLTVMAILGVAMGHRINLKVRNSKPTSHGPFQYPRVAQLRSLADYSSKADICAATAKRWENPPTFDELSKQIA